ncbi:membrane protein [Gordonia phage Evaa]|nr:membrane protein [Gordonia phage Evaa]
MILIVLSVVALVGLVGLMLTEPERNRACLIYATLLTSPMLALLILMGLGVPVT